MLFSCAGSNDKRKLNFSAALSRQTLEAVAKDILPDDSQVKVSLSLNFQEAQRPYTTTRSWAIKTIEEMVYKHEKAEETERKAKASRGEGR